LWEEKLARMTSVLGVGVSSSGDATSIVAPTPTPGTDGGVEPAPVLPPPGAFIKPSTPQLIGGLQGINVLWNGLNVDGDLWPYDTSFVEVHMDTTGTAFTPGTATLKGRLARPGSLFVGGLTAGTTYFFKLMGADPADNFTEPSDAASGQTGLTTSSDYGTATIGSGAVSFNARQIGGVTNTVGATAPESPLLNDIWLDSSPGTAIVHRIWNGSSWVANAWGSASIAAGQITALQIAAGAITAGAIAADAITGKTITGGTVTGAQITGGTITGGFISGGTVSGGFITGGTVEGSRIQTGSSGSRIVFNDAQGGVASITFFNSSNTVVGYVQPSAAHMLVSGKIVSLSELEANNFVAFAGYSGSSLDISSAQVDMPGAAGNAGATTADAGWNGNRLRAKSSNQKLKYDIAEVDGTLDGVDEARRLDVVTVDPSDVLDLGIAEFSWLEEGEPTEWRELGFIAQDVAAKFPIAASINADGEAIAVRDTPLIAALIAVVRQQRDDIQDLRARIEALEA
jgi:hypothetical protein